MEGRAIAIVTAFAIAIGFGYFANSTMNATAKRDEFVRMRDQVDSTKRAIEARRSVLTSTKESYAEAKERESAQTQLLTAKEKLDKEVTDLETSRESTLRDFIAAVKAVRTAAVGKEFPEIKIGIGQALINAKIKSFTPTEVTFTHSQGITRVPLKGLPDDLKLKFRVAMAPMVAVDEESLKVSPLIIPNSAPPDPGTKNARPKLSELQAEITRYDAQRQQLELARQDAMRRSIPQKTPGKISSSGVEAAKAAQEATGIQIQINGVNKRLEDLRALLPTALPE